MPSSKQITQKTKVMLFGTFDIIHAGHRNMFQQAKTYGNFLIVSIAREQNIVKIKGTAPRNSEQTRLAQMQKEPLVNKCFLGEVIDPFAVIKREKPDIIALGYDQQHTLAKQLPQKLKAMGLPHIKIVRLASYHPETYKSSKL
jgi:FAD synthetase